MDCCWPHFAKIQRAYDIKVVLLLVIGVEGAWAHCSISGVPTSQPKSFWLPASNEKAVCPPCSYYHIPLPNHIISPHHQRKDIVILFYLLIIRTFAQYELRLVASDNLNENYTTVVIHVNDVNDNPPVFDRPTYETQITEEDDRNLPKRVLKVTFAQVWC